MPIIAWRTREHQKRARAKNTTHVDGRRRPRSVTTSAEEMKSTAEERKEDGNANKHGRAFSAAAAALRFPIFTIFCECENQEVTSSEQGASLPLCMQSPPHALLECRLELAFLPASKLTQH